MALASVSHDTMAKKSKGLSDWNRVFRDTANRRYLVASKATARMPVVGSDAAVASVKMFSGAPQKLLRYVLRITARVEPYCA